MSLFKKYLLNKKVIITGHTGFKGSWLTLWCILSGARVFGISKFQLLRIFILNGFLIGFFGTILGVVIGLSFCVNINEIKSFIEFFTGSSLFSEEIYFFSNLPIIINSAQIIKICSISLFLSFAATVYPSIKATKVEPINLIKWD